MPSARQRQVYTPWTVGLQPTWTVDGVRGALSAHENGDFSTSAMLVDAMFRDPRLGPVTETRLKGLFGSDFRVDPADGDESDAKSVAIAEDLGEQWFDIFPESDLMALWRWRLYMGVAFGELQWERKASAWTPKLKVWNPYWVFAHEHEQMYVLQTREGQVEIPFGGGDGKWIVLGRGNRPWMDGLVRSLATPWLVATWAERDWARYSERHGMPIVKAMVPAIADEEDKDEFFNDIRSLSTETTVQLPTALDGAEGKVNFDLGLVEAKADTWEGFQGLLHHCHDNYAIALTGNNLTTLIEGGSFAASKEASERLRNFTKGDGAELTTDLREQAITWWAGYNYDGGREHAPWPHWDTEPPEDLEQRAKTIELAGKALTALAEAGWEPEDIQVFGEQFNVALKPIEEDAPDSQPEPSPPSQEPDGEPEDDDDGTEDEPEAMSRRVRKSVRTATISAGE